MDGQTGGLRTGCCMTGSETGGLLHRGQRASTIKFGGRGGGLLQH